MLYLNTAKAPFNQVSVRQAISDVIDRQQLYKVGESGYEPPANPTGLVLPSNKSFLDPTYASASYSVNTAQAAQLLASSGLTKDASGIYTQNGKELSFTIDVVTGQAEAILRFFGLM
jgi:peptide/nickel transport system substrate-binding protein